MIIDFKRNQVIFLFALIFLIIILPISVIGCQSKTKNSSKPASATSKKIEKHTAKPLANQAIKNLGSEKKAFIAILRAWDKGYSLDQIIKSIEDKTLKSNGKISAVKPVNKPQNHLKSSRPILLAATDVTVSPLKRSSPVDTNDWDDTEFKKAAWTIWLLDVISKGYSVDQITLFMLEEKLPSMILFPDLGGVITEKKIDPKTGKVIRNDNGDPQYIVVKPKFPPKGSVFNPVEIDGATKFTDDLAKDFDDLVSGKNPLKPYTGSKSAPIKKRVGKFQPRAFRFKLKLMSSNGTDTLRSSDVILRIDASGNAEGSYNAEVLTRGSVSETTKTEGGTFQGKAIYPKTKGQMIRVDLDGSRHIKSITKIFSDGRTNTSESKISIRKMFQGVLAVDYSKGTGFLYGEAAMYQWKLTD